MSCHCIEDVNLAVFRGVFTAQWLKKERFRTQDPQFFCTFCGPPAVQESLVDAKNAPLCTTEVRKKTNSNFSWSKLWSRKPSKKEKDAKSMTSKESSAGNQLITPEEEELPVTPRTDSELFLCVTCGACYCRAHARDHSYSRRHPTEDSGSSGARSENNYPHHSFFFGVPTHVSTHPLHAIAETTWGLLFPTVLIRELEEQTVDLSRPLEFYEDFERYCDSLPMVTSAAGSAGTSRGSAKLARGRSSDMWAESASSQPAGLDAPSAALGVSPSTPTKNGLSLPLYFTTPADNWGFLVYCAKCGDRPVRVAGRHYEDSSCRARRTRRLGQLMALLAYFRRRGVTLTLPKEYESFMSQKEAMQNEALQRQRTTLDSYEAQRVGKSSEMTTSAFSETLAQPPSTPSRTSVPRFIQRAETDRLLRRAGICGFSNPSYMCYFNAVLQCVLRSTFFCDPLAEMSLKSSPGKLTTSLINLIQHLRQQTYQDVRNGAAYPFVRSVYNQICKLSSLFEADEQQDSQELLLCLLNGVADEFDSGKTAEQKRQSRRISFEGVLRTEVICSACHRRCPREEMFMTLSIPSQGSIQDGLKSLFTPSKLTGKDRYACEHCFTHLTEAQQAVHNAKAKAELEARKARQGGSKTTPAEDSAKDEALIAPNCLYEEAEVHTDITRLGGTLAVHLLRFQYDPASRGFIKITTPISIPLRIDLSSFVSTEVLEAYARERNIQSLSARFPSASLSAIRAHLDKARGDSTAAARLLAADGFPSEVSGCGSVKESSNSSDNLPTAKSSVPDKSHERVGSFDVTHRHTPHTPSLTRQLVGIVAHRGSLHGGHYIAYVRYLTQPDIWFRCDDEDVDIVDEQTVLNCASEVYLAFYE